jgi:hypothetical protein
MRTHSRPLPVIIAFAAAVAGVGCTVYSPPPTSGVGRGTRTSKGDESERSASRTRPPKPSGNR